ncbi:MAG: zeta toxin family protein [Bacteroidaceae bacterium]|nr:zeta toxin family protein [Bacteroidaceae bacterium]
MAQKIYIIAGCNGAGKTTASLTLLPQILQCEEFVNADEIARGLSPFHPEKVSMEAGRLMLERISSLMQRRETFALETTLSTRSYLSLIKRAHKAGYQVELLYFWLSSPEVAIRRVKQRVAEGGHNIPEDVIRRRYDAGIRNLINIYSGEVDRWFIIDNNTGQSAVIAEMNGGITKIYNFDRFKRIMDHGLSRK